MNDLEKKVTEMLNRELSNLVNLSFNVNTFSQEEGWFLEILSRL